MIAAICKADGLYAFAKGTGSPMKDFALVLTKGEAYELLDYMAAGGLGRYQNHEMLIEDIAEAKVAGDPFALLQHFQIKGFDVISSEVIH